MFTFNIIDIRDPRCSEIIAKEKLHDDYYQGFMAFESNTNEYAGYIEVWPKWILKKHHGNLIAPLEVVDKYRGHGLGTLLLEMAINKLDANMLFVNTNNNIAINLYTKFDFVIIDTLKYKNKSHYIMKRSLSSVG